MKPLHIKEVLQLRLAGYMNSLGRTLLGTNVVCNLHGILLLATRRRKAFLLVDEATRRRSKTQRTCSNGSHGFFGCNMLDLYASLDSA